METCKKIDKKIVSWKIKQPAIESERPTEIAYSYAPKRPLELVCDIKKAKVNKEGWTLFIGLLNEKPYEVFGGLSKYIDIPNKYKTGRIVKNGKDANGLSTYNLIVGEGDDEMIVKDVSNVFENTNYGAFTRTISLAMRHGTPVQYIVEQLGKDKYSDMTSFSTVMARVLKTYIKDGVKPSSEKKCPNCGEDGTLAYESGCISCKSCLWSRCS